MKLGLTNAKRIVILGALSIATFLLPSMAEAGTVLIQTVGSNTNAVYGYVTSGTFDIVVVVTNPVDGSAVSNLGDSASGPLPTGWALQLIDWPGGPPDLPGNFRPTTFTNKGNGVYVLGGIYGIFDPASYGCSVSLPCWLWGDYIYAVQLNVTVSGVTYTGTGLGVLEVPSHR